ncbi:DUF3238 domain-containing protein [Bacillus sp. DJP31]|uniref:DUF3238 domain-containing protein n=1 Tax=Bacillus sp. DJP31 TaxID=3409789 RepID=UPI003BB6DF54
MEYDLYALNKFDKILDYYHIVTAALHPKNKSELGIDIISSKDSLKLDWFDIKNAANLRYSINQNDFINLTDSEVIIKDLAEDESFVITVFADDLSNKDKAEFELKGDHYIKIPAKTVKNVIGGKIDFTDLGNEAISPFQIATLAYGPVSSFKHTTFIAPSLLKFEPFGLSLQCGKGDGRSFSKTSSKYRTQLNVSVYWDDLSFGNTNYASSSTKYDRYCNTSSAQTLSASNSGMYVSKIFITSAEAKLYVNHSAKSPFYNGLMPAIDYNYELTLGRNGVTYVYGRHDKFPWHEIYRAENGGSWAEIYTFTPDNGGSDVWKLTEFWPDKYFNAVK